MGPFSEKFFQTIFYSFYHVTNEGTTLVKQEEDAASNKKVTYFKRSMKFTPK